MDQLQRWAFIIQEKTGSAPDGITPVAPQSDLANSLQQQLAAAAQQQNLLAAIALQGGGASLANLLPGLQNFNLQALLMGQGQPAPAAQAAAPQQPSAAAFFDYGDDDDDDDDDNRIQKQKQRIEMEQRRRREEEDRIQREKEERARLAAAHHQQLQNIASQPEPTQVPQQQPQQFYQQPPMQQQQQQHPQMQHQGPRYPGQSQPPMQQQHQQQPPAQHFNPHAPPQYQPQQQQQPQGQQLSVVEDVYDDPNVPEGHKKVLTQTLFVGNLSPGVSDLMLYAAFAQYGSVIAMKYHQDKHFAFISFPSRKEAEAAKKSLHFVALDGREMKVGWANPYAEPFEWDRDNGYSIVPLNAVPRFTPNPVSSRFIEKMRKDFSMDPSLLQRVLGQQQPQGAGGPGGDGRPKRKYENGGETSFAKRTKYDEDPFEITPQQSFDQQGGGSGRGGGGGYYNKPQQQYSARGGGGNSYRDNRSSSYGNNNYGSSGGGGGGGDDDFSVPMLGSGR
jgi:RNA recognition motif-containing protein